MSFTELFVKPFGEAIDAAVERHRLDELSRRAFVVDNEIAANNAELARLQTKTKELQDRNADLSHDSRCLHMLIEEARS